MLELTPQPQRRNIYVNGKLEFSFFYDSSQKEHKQIAEDFFASREWKHFLSYTNFKVETYRISDDLKEFRIVGIEKKN